MLQASRGMFEDGVAGLPLGAIDAQSCAAELRQACKTMLQARGGALKGSWHERVTCVLRLVATRSQHGVPPARTLRHQVVEPPLHCLTRQSCRHPPILPPPACPPAACRAAALPSPCWRTVMQAAQCSTSWHPARCCRWVGCWTNRTGRVGSTSAEHDSLGLQLECEEHTPERKPAPQLAYAARTSLRRLPAGPPASIGSPTALCLQVRCDCPPEHLLDFLCSSAGLIANEAAVQVRPAPLLLGRVRVALPRACLQAWWLWRARDNAAAAAGLLDHAPTAGVLA